MRIFKSHPLLKLVNSYVIDSPQPSNISYLWNFGSLLAICLIIQIVTGITLAMHYNSSVLEAFNSVEHIMRDVNNGWLIRYLHSNTASAFFFLVYLHIGRGLYYGSYKAPRTLVWTIGTVIFILMIATAFLGYVLPYGQMSLWGIKMPKMYSLDFFSFSFSLLFVVVLIMIINLINNTISNKIKGMYRIGPHHIDIISIIYGSLLGKGHAEKRLLGVGTRIFFYQESPHVKYIFYLHKVLLRQGYCNHRLPVIRQTLGAKGLVRKFLKFHTWTYTSFNWIHDEWYVNGIKRVPNNLELYLTPLALAVWIMDDGESVGRGLKLSTNNFTYEECIYLMCVLYNNFNLKASVEYTGSNERYILYIRKESMPNLTKIISPYVIPVMKYKII